MQDLLDYFEGLDEAVYISDIETDELVFMNRCLRERFGYTETNTYVGRKCYEVLQGRDAPCHFCNNKQLQQGAFFTWEHENPVLHQHFLIKDTIILSNGRKYRVEVASAVDHSDIVEKAMQDFTRRETVLNECLQLFFSTPDPEQSLYELLQYLGNNFLGDRTYIFEFYNDTTTSNTYEWCATGVKPQIDILQDLPLSDIAYWLEIFEKGNLVEIADIEDIRKEYPATYSLLKPQKIYSLVAAPIWEDDTLKGFIGVDNPAPEMLPILTPILKEIANYMQPQLNRRDLYRRFNQMSCRDLLTGAYNQNAIIEHDVFEKHWKSVGIVYCDINGLKETNNTLGLEAGNQLIRECHHILKQSMHTEWIYRIGGDEFVACYYDVSEEKFKRDVEALRLAMIQSICQVSIGYAWSQEQPIDIQHIMHEAETNLYEEKEQYYEQLTTFVEDTASTMKDAPYFFSDKNATEYTIKLQRFLSNTYCDVSFLLTAFSGDISTNYLFFGDMQKNLFFISDNMRKRFGFENNIVSDLIQKWASRIVDPDLLKRFWDDINAILEKKKSYHDLRYQITDVYGNNVWIRCTGKLKWNEDGTKPLFFAGCIMQQDEDFVVDLLTNFPTESVLAKELEEIQQLNKSCQAIGFSFHNITQINNNYGRSYGDNLIQRIAIKLNNALSNQMTFYRLSGMRCVALTNPHTEQETRALIANIKGIIDKAYQMQGVALQSTCSFAVMEYPQEHVSAKDFIENITSLIKVAHQSPAQLYIDDSDGNIKKIQKASNLERNLIENILNDMENFRIVIQPVVSTQDQRPVGGETLLRWRFEGKEVSPGIFIPIIENEHMIHLVGRWVFEQAVHSCVRILTYDPDFYLTVNVSLQQLHDEGFIDFIRQTLCKYDLDGKHIVMELTESCMDDQPEKLDRFVNACADMHIRIALDDFGSGYSSLRVLLRYPSNIIKLDRSLLLEMSDSFEKSGFITSIVYACHQFDKTVCMEGVETEFQNELVREAGCDLIQGFYYYKPMEVEQIYQLFAEQYGEHKE